MLTSKEIRQKYLNFFKTQGHVIIPSASLIPENDSSTLFIGSGMQPLVPYLLGEKHPNGTRLVNSQKSFRAEDIEEVGDNRHTTFFEMLGNWSLGDYFKKEQLTWFFEFLTKEVNVDPNRLYVSVFRGNSSIGIEKDVEAVEIWKKLFAKAGIEAKDVDLAEEKGLQDGRIFYYSDNKNWWSRSGVPEKMPVGEIGGPDSEMFYDLGENLGKHEKSQWKNELCHVNCDCGRFIEIGNCVFMQFMRTEKGFEQLPQKNVDFGGGLERLTMVCQDKDNIFETDLFINVIRRIEVMSGKKYRENMKAFEVIADHMRGATFIMGDDKGIEPSNTDQGYIVRRLIRRAVRYGRQLGIREEKWTKEIAEIIVADYSEIYSELEKNQDFIYRELDKEEEKFDKTLEKGIDKIDKLFTLYKGNIKEFSLDAKTLFDLYQTNGFPIELSMEEINLKRREHGGVSMPSDVENLFIALFNEEMEKHQELSKTASAGKFKGGLADASVETTKLHTAAHLLLAALRKVLGEHIHQKGSNITAERLRFDFSHPEKLTPEQKEQLERIVNEIIEKDVSVICQELSLDEARSKGAEGVFENKYGERVKVYQIGDFSNEICGGPHVERTGILGKFKILKEESSSSGVRRIKAVLE